MRADHASLQSTDWSQGDTLGIIALFNEGEQTMGVQDHASTGKPRRRGLRIASGIIGAAALLAAGTLGTMRLGWWNPSYDEVVAEQATGPSRFEMVGPVKLHVRDEGQGPVILMLHSSMSNLRIWDGWADQLKKSYRVVRFDWPPYGMSVDPRASQGMPTVVDLIERFVAQKRLRNFVIVASSSGATIATMYTARARQGAGGIDASAQGSATHPNLKAGIDDVMDAREPRAELHAGSLLPPFAGGTLRTAREAQT
jgi:hypothetical protein